MLAWTFVVSHLLETMREMMVSCVDELTPYQVPNANKN